MYKSGRGHAAAAELAQGIELSRVTDLHTPIDVF